MRIQTADFNKLFDTTRRKEKWLVQEFLSYGLAETLVDRKMIDNDVLARGGLYLDEMTKKLRLLHPDNHQLSHDLVTECGDYRQTAHEFRKNVKTIIGGLTRMTSAADKAKMDTFGKRSRLIAIIWQREISKQRLMQEIAEKKALLERRRGHHQSMLRTDLQQKETLFRLARK